MQFFRRFLVLLGQVLRSNKSRELQCLCFFDNHSVDSLGSKAMFINKQINKARRRGYTCKKISQSASADDIESPAPVSARLAELACEEENKIKRNEVLIADITPDSTGELYFYVNDAILFWDRADHHTFYRNNSGKAKITVTRTLAPATVDFNSAEGGQPQSN
jgi:hypothetical protein